MGQLGLNRNSVLTCPHGGKVEKVTFNTRVKITGDYWDLMSNQDLISGCSSANPCIKVLWMTAATRVKVNGQPVLLQTSTGTCLSAYGPNGTVLVMKTQNQVSAL